MSFQLTNRVLLIARNNPFTYRPTMSLHPEPKGGAGWRILKMLQTAVPSVTPQEYMLTFERRNVLDKKIWDEEWGRATGPLLWEEISGKGRHVMIFGRSAVRCLRLPKTLPLVWHVTDDTTWCFCPRPETPATWYISPYNRQAFIYRIEDLYLRSRAFVFRR